MKQFHKRVAMVLAIGTLLFVAVSTAYADNEVIPRFTFGGGAERVASEGFVMRGGMGQPIASVARSESGSQVCTGFECGLGAAPADTPTPAPDPSETPTSDPSETPTSDPSETPTSEPSETPTPDAPTPEPPQPGSSNDIVISEVYYQGNADSDWIELKNIGDGTVDISEWHFCALFSYKKLGDDMTVLQGDLSLEPGEVIVLKAWTDLDANGTGSDLAIYKNDESKPEGRPDFNDPNYMVDFVQWGTAEDVGRPDVAVAKGIWAQTSNDPVLYDYVQRAASGEAIALKSSNRGSASADFANQAPTQGTSNVEAPPSGTFSDHLFLPIMSGGGAE